MIVVPDESVETSGLAASVVSCQPQSSEPASDRVHAVRPGVLLDDQQERDPLWIRDEFTEDRSDHGIKVIHGHCGHRASRGSRQPDRDRYRGIRNRPADLSRRWKANPGAFSSPDPALWCRHGARLCGGALHCRITGAGWRRTPLGVWPVSRMSPHGPATSEKKCRTSTPKEPLNNLPCTCLKRFGLREVNRLPSTPEP